MSICSDTTLHTSYQEKDVPQVPIDYRTPASLSASRFCYCNNIDYTAPLCPIVDQLEVAKTSMDVQLNMDLDEVRRQRLEIREIGVHQYQDNEYLEDIMAKINHTFNTASRYVNDAWASYEKDIAQGRARELAVIRSVHTNPIERFFNTCKITKGIKSKYAEESRKNLERRDARLDKLADAMELVDRQRIMLNISKSLIIKEADNVTFRGMQEGHLVFGRFDYYRLEKVVNGMYRLKIGFMPNDESERVLSEVHLRLRLGGYFNRPLYFWRRRVFPWYVSQDPSDMTILLVDEQIALEQNARDGVHKRRQTKSKTLLCSHS